MLYPTKSFFARTLFTLLPFTVVVVLLYSTLIWTSINVTEDQVVNGYLDHEVERFQQSYTNNPAEASLPSTSYLHSYWESDPTLPPSFRELAPGSYELDDERTHVKVVYIPAAAQKFYVQLDESQLSSLDEYTSLLCSIIWTLAGLVVIAGAIMAVIGARHLASPITLLADAVGGDRRAGAPFPGHERRDEVGTLSRALTDLIERLQVTLERERAFTRHTSHELRTPLAIMRNSLAVIRLPNCDQQKLARNLDRLEHASGEMETMVQLFLYLGREDERMPSHLVALRPLLQACEQKYADLIKSKQQRTIIDVDPDLHIDAPPSAIQVLVSNLMGNALQHGEDFMHIEANAKWLRIINGVRFNPSPSAGFGYGLDIVQRLSIYCGWTLTVTSEADRFSVTVAFESENA